MEIKLLNIKPSTRKNKRLMATFKLTKKGYEPKDYIVHFGAKNGSTFIDHKDQTKRTNWLKRHSYSLEKADYIPWSPAVLSWKILWNKPTLKKSIKDYKKTYGL